jgi:hypothetical protein
VPAFRVKRHIVAQFVLWRTGNRLSSGRGEQFDALAVIDGNCGYKMF